MRSVRRIIIFDALTVATLLACGARTELDGRATEDASAHDVVLEATEASDALVDHVTPDAGAPVPFLASFGGTCAIDALGSIKCWGTPVGDGTSSRPLTATSVHDVSAPVVQVAVGPFATCLRLQSEEVQCWGSDLVPDGSLVPTLLASPNQTSDLSVGNHHSCVVVSGGVKCWGGPDDGALGNGLSKASATPVDVVGLVEPAIAVSAHAVFSCALLQSGRVQCWGQNNAGQLGDGTFTNAATPAAIVSSVLGAIAITNGQAHACVITSTKGVECWGDGQAGELGDGTFYDAATVGSVTPVAVLGLAGPVKAISAQHFTTCALLETGGVQCWGGNANGDLGDGTTIDRAVAAYVNGLTTDVVAISSKCALMADGSARCWGGADLGDGTMSGSVSPVKVIGLP